jgi:hypothetical protein
MFQKNVPRRIFGPKRGGVTGDWRGASEFVLRIK